MENFSDEEVKFYNLVLPFTFRDLQICIQVKKHLEINGSNVDDLELFLQNFVISKDGLVRKKRKKLNEEEKQLRKERLKSETYGLVDTKP